MGKGGSGKTTISAAFIRYASSKVPYILAIDGDVNVHLGTTLDMETKDLAERAAEVYKYLEPERTIPLIGTTPPNALSRFIRPTASDSFISQFATSKGNIGLLTAGTYTANDVGYSCYHGKLGVVESVYHHMLDTPNDLVVADATAGIDSLGTSLFFVSDINVFIIEPTLKGIAVVTDFLSVSKDLDVPVYVILNKVEGPDDLEFVHSKINKKRILGSIPHSKLLKRFEQGDITALNEFAFAQSELFDSIVATARNHPRNWNKYHNLLKKTYVDNCRSWYNDYYGLNLEREIDHEFSYERI